MMTRELNKTIELAGVELDVVLDFDANYVDNGFDHEFGTEHRWEWEADGVTDIMLDGDLFDAVRRHYDWSSVWLKGNHKRLRKAIKRTVAQIRRAWMTMDLNELANNNELVEACGDAPERDYD